MTSKMGKKKLSCPSKKKEAKMEIKKISSKTHSRPLLKLTISQNQEVKRSDSKVRPGRLLSD